MSAHTVKGSCHCGAIQYTAHLDLNGQTIRCNCSICTKARGWIAPIPVTQFDLASGASTLREYAFGGHAITHCFCSECGVKTHGRIRGDSGETEWIAVCVSTLDLTPEQLAALPISYANGRDDLPDHAPDLVSYL